MIYIPLYFPSVNFGIFRAEVFPWAFLLSIFLIKRFDRFDLLLLLGLCISAIYSAFRGAEVFEIFRSLGAYFNFFAAYMIAKQMSYADIRRVIELNKIIFFLLIGFGLIQFLQIAPFLDPAIKFLVPRGSSESLTEFGGRGASLLASEPARAGIEFVFIYLLFRISISDRFRLAADIFVFLFLLVIIKSVMAICLYLVFFALTHIRASLVFSLLLIFLIPFVGDGLSIGRVGSLIGELANSDIEEAFFIVVNSSGHRLFSVWTSFYHGFAYPFGGGVGAWKQSSMHAIELTGYDVSALRFFQFWGDGSPVPIRSSGLISSMMLDLGILYTCIFWYFMHRNIRKRLSMRYLEALPLIMVFAVKIFFIGSVGTTVEVFCFFVLLRALTGKREKFEGKPNSRRLMS